MEKSFYETHKNEIKKIGESAKKHLSRKKRRGLIL